VKVNVAVCGKFHYDNYIRYLHEYGVLGRFYYSHKINREGSAFGIGKERLINLWLKEYLFRLHGHLTGGWMTAELHHIYTDLWECGALRRWARCDVFHFTLDGACRGLIRRAQQDEGVIVGEAVTCHPSLFGAILRQEYEMLGVDYRPRFYTAWERQLEELEKCEMLLTPSRFVCDSFVEAGFPSSGTAVLPYGVELQKFYPDENVEDVKTRSSVFRVICVGGISVHKGQIYLLEAWKKLGLRNAELLLIGPIAARMRTVLRRYEGLFRHIPFVPNNEIRREYARSSVFVLPSVQDGFGLVSAEAMACRLPVIVTVNTGAADIVAHGENGFVVPIRSPDAIAEGIEVLYRDRTLRQAMADAALTKARNELGWDKYADRLCDFYRTALKHSGRRPGVSKEVATAEAP
jgi:glycosyltransferase involved in cell wall biosynthesis